jgi:hypothetical protein
LSSASQKIWPQKRVNVGKFSDASIPARSMSVIRATGSYAEGCISSNGTGAGENSSLRFPRVTERPDVGVTMSSYSQREPLSSWTIRGPTSRYRFGSRDCQRSGGSIT